MFWISSFLATLTIRKNLQGGDTTAGEEDESAPGLHRGGDHVGKSLGGSELCEPLRHGAESTGDGSKAAREDFRADDPRQT